MVTREAAGAPPSPDPMADAPIAPDPLVPEVLTPVNVITAIDESTLCDNVAVTDAEGNTLGANARQISDVPSCTFARDTRAHARPPPVTLCTVVLGEVTASAETNANNNSF